MARLTALGLLGLLVATGCGGRTANGGAGGATTGSATDGAGGSTGGASGAAGSGGGAVDPGPEFNACSGPGQCKLIPATCCARCGLLVASDLVAVHKDRERSYVARVCAGNITCDPCLSAADHHLMARCDEGRCVAIDIRNEPSLTGCNAHLDCTLRKGLACCGNCTAPDWWVAVEASQGMQKIIDAQCAAGSGCAGCLTHPPDTAALCVRGVCERVP